MTSGNHGGCAGSRARFCVAAVALLGPLGGCGADDAPADQGRQMAVLPPVTAGQGGGAAVAGGGGSTQQPIAAPSLGPAGSGGTAGGSAGSGAAGMPVAPSAGTGGMGAAGMAVDAGTGGSAAPPVPAGDACARWKADRTSLSEGAWDGDAAACEAGDMTEEARTNAHRLVNLYRFMAGLPEVEMTAEGNRLAQGCALLMTANGTLSHTPPESWKCYTAEAASTAGSSSLSPGGSVSSVDGYMIDPGNPTTLGHRRWVLSSMLAGIGFGSTGSFSCQYQPPRRPPADAKPWVAWPPPGQVPIQALGSTWSSVDQTGWSVQSDTIAVENAQVTVTSGGADMAVTVTALNPGYGSMHAMRFNATGWKATAGQSYHVALSGTSSPIEYDVEVVDCP